MNTDHLTFSSNKFGCSSIRVAEFPDGHEYESWCKCAQCVKLTDEFKSWHEQSESDAASLLAPCPFCGGFPHFEYEGAVNFCVNLGFPSNGVWVECGCGCQLGRGGMTSQEEDTGVYGGWNEAVLAWNSRPPIS